MFRIDDPSAVVALPEPEAAGREGFFTEGAPGVKDATLVRASFLNMLQEELRNVVVAGGIVPSKTDYSQLLRALRSAGVFQTAPQFDASTKPATMAALQRGLGNLRGVRAVSASAILSVDDVGMLIEIGGSLPLALALPSPNGISGATINLQLGTSAKVTLSTPAGFIFANGTFAASLSIQGISTSLALVSDGGNWTQYGNTGSSSLAQNGFQSTAGGVLEQWGVITLGAPGTSTVWTYPTPFPSVAPYGLWACNSASGPTPYFTSSNSVPGLSSASFTSNAPTGVIAFVRAIGKSS